jgi:predicted nucleic acid-binding protein
MKLVVDANILFAALIKEGFTAELMLSDKLQLFAPEFLFTEFKKYEEFILKKTHRSSEDFHRYLKLLEDYIVTIPKREITPFIEKTREISLDPKHVIYFALALALNSSIWSNDKQMKDSQTTIRIYSTSDLRGIIDFLKK